MMEIPKNTCSLLQKWNGKKAKLWFYTASFQKLVIRIEEEGDRGNLHIICSACISIKAPVYWNKCSLEIEIAEKDALLGATFIVRDVAADAIVRCRSIGFDENADPMF